MTVELAHPTEPSATQEVGSDRIVMARMDRCSDPKWHFRMAVPRDWRLGPQGQEAPGPDSALTLALFKRSDPEVDLEVIGHELQYEIDPADWLEQSLTLDGKTIVSTQHKHMLAGVVGDAVVRWQVDGVPYAGRFFASKWGPRLFVVCLRAPEEHYNRFADDFFLSIASFQAVDDSLGLFAERVNAVAEKRPVPWELVMPVSWLVEPEPMFDPEVASLQARQHPHEGDLSDFAGHLSLAVVARSKHKKARELGDLFLDMLRERGIEIEPAEFEEEEPRKGFVGSWLLVSPATHLGCAAETRCRVMAHRSAWVLAGVLSPWRDDDMLAWMRNKRVLDIATSTLEIGG